MYPSFREWKDVVTSPALKVAVREINLPPKNAAVVLASVELPGPKRRQSLYGGQSTTGQNVVAESRRRGIVGIQTPLLCGWRNNKQTWAWCH